jgi:hypothetical protein
MILGALVNRMPVALWILAIGSNITVIHRIVHTWKQTLKPDPAVPEQLNLPRVTKTVQMKSPREAPEPSTLLSRTAGRRG